MTETENVNEIIEALSIVVENEDCTDESMDGMDLIDRLGLHLARVTDNTIQTTTKNNVTSKYSCYPTPYEVWKRRQPNEYLHKKSKRMTESLWQQTLDRFDNQIWDLNLKRSKKKKKELDQEVCTGNKTN